MNPPDGRGWVHVPKPPARGLGPVLAIGSRAHVTARDGTSRKVPLLDDNDAPTAVHVPVETVVEVLAWKPRSQAGTRYLVRVIGQTTEGWLATDSVRAIAPPPRPARVAPREPVAPARVRKRVTEKAAAPPKAESSAVKAAPEKAEAAKAKPTVEKPAAAKPASEKPASDKPIAAKGATAKAAAVKPTSAAKPKAASGKSAAASAKPGARQATATTSSAKSAGARPKAAKATSKASAKTSKSRAGSKPTRKSSR